jgi:hypothetical protein
MRFQVLTATIKKPVVWNMTPYILVEVYQRVSSTMTMEAAGSSGTSVNFYKTTLRHISEDIICATVCHGAWRACEIFTR